MQPWFSIGCLARKMFVSFKSKKLIHVKRKKKKNSEDRGDACMMGAWEAEKEPHEIGTESPPTVCLQLPRLSLQGSPPRSSIMGRHSDAMAGFPRFSTSSSSCYERLSVEYHPSDGQNVVKLGMGPNRLARQGSMDQHRDSSCSVASFMSATSSRLKGAYAQHQRDASKKQPHIGELFAGNQLFMHLTVAPPVFASPYDHAKLMPSSGFLNASMRCREADLKDRIILFL